MLSAHQMLIISIADSKNHVSVLLHADLPGFTRSVYERDHALVAPESRVWAGQRGW